jgi:hypothetical protein
MVGYDAWHAERDPKFGLPEEEEELKTIWKARIIVANHRPMRKTDCEAGRFYGFMKRMESLERSFRSRA